MRERTPSEASRLSLDRMPIKVPWVSWLLCAGLLLAQAAVVCAEDGALPAIEDGKEAQAWEVRPDQGAQFATPSQAAEVGAYGKQSFRLDVKVDAKNDWWSVFRCTIDENPDRGQFNAVRIMCRVSVPLPANALNLALMVSGKRAATAPALPAPGTWLPVDMRLPDSQNAKGPVRCEIAIKHTIPGTPEAFTVHVDGPAWTRLEEEKITELKDLRVATALVANSTAAAIIAAPPGDRYDDAVTVLQNAVKRETGITLPVLRDSTRLAQAAELLKSQNVIALGNMATNPFTEEMYRKWYVMLDLRYPGPGGYVVRSCHNPLATGHNVIWLGGSDDDGVLAAAKTFAGGLKADGAKALNTGWLMDIKLGAGMTPPRIGDDVPEWVVYSWRDSFRKQSEEKTIGYDPSSYFGWSPISIAGVLYYMTGQKEYLDYFKAMAMPAPGNIPLPNRTNASFNDPMDPLVKNYHYRAHLHVCVYDLIEESPLFTDDERLFLSNKFVQHQIHYDAGDSFCNRNGSRHDMWHMLCIYTGSRYLSKYYPDPRWTKRIENARRMFASILGNPTWGERDTLSWVSTSTEPVFEFFMLDGFNEFVKSGTARTMFSALETLWTNTQFEEANSCLTINLLHKAAYMLRDGRCIWLRDRLGFDLDAFRIGQSFWPKPELQVKPPLDLVGQVRTFPLPERRWFEAGRSVPLEEGFQFLAYRGGLEPGDDVLQVDGFYGKARTAYHVNALYNLRMFGGKRVFHHAYANKVTVRANGMVEPVVPRAAALKCGVALDGAVYIHASVPNMAFSAWDRHLVSIPDRYLLAFDRVTGRNDGVFDVTVTWAPHGTPALDPADPRRAVCPNGPVIQCAQPVKTTCSGRVVSQVHNGRLTANEERVFTNVVYWSDAKTKPDITLEPLGPRAAVIRGSNPAFVALALRKPPPTAEDRPTTTPALPLVHDGDMLYAAGDRIFLVRGTTVTCGDLALARADKPVSLSWQTQAGTLAVDAAEACQLTLASADTRELALRKGPQQIDGLRLAPEAAQALTVALTAAGQAGAAVSEAALAGPAATADWQAVWTTDLGDGVVTSVAAAPVPEPTGIWAALADRLPVKRAERGQLALLAPDGNVRKVLDLDSPVHSLWAAADATQGKAFTLLAGAHSDAIQAYDADGKVRWEQKAEVHPSFKIGDRYQAPWFSDPRPPRGHTGVFQLLVGDLWGTGTQQVVAARPVTLEFRELDGTLIKRVPTQWGDNTTLAVLRKREDPTRSPWVLTGKLVTGSDRVSGVANSYNVVSNSLYGAVAKGATPMGAWMQRGITHLAVADLDADGFEEVVIVRSGHWNQLQIYDEDKGACRWQASFGPGNKGTRLMTGLVVADLTGDGKQEVVVGMRNGWVCAFDFTGTALWQRLLDVGVSRMCPTQTPGTVAVARSDGTVHLMDAAGKGLRTAATGAPVTALCNTRLGVLAGTEEGKLLLLR